MPPAIRRRPIRVRSTRLEALRRSGPRHIAVHTDGAPVWRKREGDNLGRYREDRKFEWSNMALRHHLDKRRSPRRYACRIAEVIAAGHEQPIDCVLHDISDGGARLNFFIPLMRLPRTFTLLFFQDSSLKRDCEVMWTAGSFAGVRFMSPWYSASKGGPRADRAPLLAEENGSYA